MKLSSWAWACALTGCLFAGDAQAQGLRQPFSVRPAGFDYNRYLQDEPASPSDQPAPAAAAQETQAPAPVVGSGACDNGGRACDACGCANACNSCGGCSSCGCGLGSNLVGLLEDHCCLGEPYTLTSHLFCENSPWSVGGWSQVGYHNKSTLLFNNAPGKVRLHQQWAYIERTAAADPCSWDWGFRADFMYGIDADDTQAFGNPVDANGNPRGYDTGWNHGIYGFALPQLYGELARGDLSVKIGHFYTLVGYEVVQATGNFFYSHAFTFYNNEPFTHTGVLATYKVSDNLDVYGGWTLGWDTGFDQFNDGSNYLGGFGAQLTDDLKLTYIAVIGDFGFRGDQGYMSSTVVDSSLTDKLNYVFQFDYLNIDSIKENSLAINQYLFYTVTDCVKLGGRIEWWKADALTNPIPGAPPLGVNFGDASVYEATFGVNYIPQANLRIRPEIRQQWCPAANYDETIFGIDVIATY